MDLYISKITIKLPIRYMVKWTSIGTFLLSRNDNDATAVCYKSNGEKTASFLQLNQVKQRQQSKMLFFSNTKTYLNSQL